MRHFLLHALLLMMLLLTVLHALLLTLLLPALRRLLLRMVAVVGRKVALLAQAALVIQNDGAHPPTRWEAVFHQKFGTGLELQVRATGFRLHYELLRT